jgi:glycosyltransferase involved in cell wall biosynthesis
VIPSGRVINASDGAVDARRAARRILFISNTTWSLYNFRRSTIAALTAQGFEVVCVAPSDEYCQRLESELGVRHYGWNLKGASTNPLRECWALLSLLGLLLQLRPRFVFNFTVKGNIYSGLLCRLLRIPYANNVSGLGTAFLHDRRLFRLVRRVYGRANGGAQRVFFQNPDDFRLFQATGLADRASAVQLPGSGVDLTHFQPAAATARPPFVFLMLARLLGDKGVREFVAAARMLRAKGYAVRAILVGGMADGNQSGIQTGELRDWTEEGVVEYFGHQGDVRPFLHSCHVVVLPSYREGLPRSVLEAAACCRPALVSDVPGCRHAVRDGVTGWLCPPRDAEGLAARMEDVMRLSDAELQTMGAAAREFVERQFSDEIVIRATLECLREIA